MEVLLRFREHPIAFSADIEAMFNNFLVLPYERDLLRYFWFKENIADNELVSYRLRCHLFGCTSSPAVVAYGIKFYAAQNTSPEFGVARDCTNK